MKTEELGWLRLASHLHMPLTEVKRKTSSSEFVLWMEYLEWDINAFDKIAFYLAQVAMEVRRSYVKNPKSVRFEDFIMKFRSKKEPPEVPANATLKVQKEKQFFFSLTGLLGSAGKKRK